MVASDGHGGSRRAMAFLVLFAVPPFLAACGGQAPGAQPFAGNGVEKALDAATPTLDTYVPGSIEIDQLTADFTDPADANLFTGLDPADDSASALKPLEGPGSYIDWDDIALTDGVVDPAKVADHVLYDFSVGKDPSAFPQSNECVASAQVLSKMDLTYVAAANNTKYAYLAVQRSDNNGDAGYYWVFTKAAPRLVAGEAPCSATQKRLLYDISVGDVLVGGHFHPNGTPLLHVWKAAVARTSVPANAAINFTDATLWTLDPDGVAAVAVNTTPTAPGAFGAQGVKAVDAAGNLGAETFAEAAVPVEVFTGASVCGAQFYGTVITRSSGAGGTSPDLKDLSGPALYNFGSATAAAALTPSCDAAFGFALTSFTGMDGQAATPASCEWTFTEGGGVSTDCSGTVTGVAPGTYGGTLVATDAFGCSATVNAGTVNVYAPLSATAKLTATCTLAFGYLGTHTGGSGAVSYAWGFSGGGTTTPGTSTDASGTVAVGTGAVAYTGDLVVTDLRSDLAGCTAPAQDTATPFAPLAVALAITAAPAACPAMASDAVTYASAASGGNGGYTYQWNDVGCTGASCTVDPVADTFCFGQTFTLTLGDTSGICPPVTSKPATYGKVSTVTATVE